MWLNQIMWFLSGTVFSHSLFSVWDINSCLVFGVAIKDQKWQLCGACFRGCHWLKCQCFAATSSESPLVAKIRASSKKDLTKLGEYLIWDVQLLLWSSDCVVLVAVYRHTNVWIWWSVTWSSYCVELIPV